ncbi:MAG TPA: MerR family transcriptional regulator [Streptosporangiaceae bacterium]|nr:MerR family transcriptional regulator [Streptosporangiaceae bacterium]
MDDLLTIGEFSLRCGLSPKVLRTYAADGLLTPAAVDRVSGYRYYAPSQVRAASTIALLRRAGTPLRDIASFLARPAAARLDQLAAWQRDLDAELTVRRQALREVRASMTGVLPSAGAGGAGGAGGADESAAPGRELANSPACRFTAASATAAGRGRARNQDAVLLGDALFAVADGMGEHGDIASLLAVEILEAGFAADPTMAGLAAACRAASAAVWRRADQEAEATTGSTVTALAVLGAGGATPRVDDSQRIERKIVHHDGGPAGAAPSDHGATAGPPGSGRPALAVASVGDSRAYLRRDGVLRRLTQDHSLVAGLVRAGVLTEAEARTHPQRSLLTRALGTGPDVEPGLARVDHEPGDRLLLCTDGVFGALDSGEIDAALAAADRPGEAADELVRLARDRGEDDVSVIVIDVGAGPGGEPRA